MLEKTPSGLLIETGRTIIRKPALLTTAYILCNYHRADGNIGAAHAAQLTLWMDISFGSLSSIELKALFLDKINLPDIVRWTDLASVAESLELTRSTSGGAFVEGMVGYDVIIHAGTNFAPGIYRVTAFNSATSVDLATDPTTGGDGSAGKGVLLAGHQELTFDVLDGLSTMSKLEFAIPSSAGDGSYIMTIPTAAAVEARIFIKGTGTATGSSAIVSVTKMPDGGL